ncbi:stage III sporulation protein AF [Anaerovorax sp. IOR16]|uniref:stage III sporulation protein AF n=1 Tax=Anaerovorax sp. IOR16 TaxID=2773458 RepID=UPI0019D2D4C0|nr:stage III sporulation protein AF [Anaerovorax sp. IOR16]
MSFVTEWVRNVFLIVLAISFLELLLPSGSMRGYLKFIFSLLLLTVMLYPLQSLGGKEILAFHSIPYSFSAAQSYEINNDASFEYDLSQVQTKQISDVYKEKVSESIKEELEKQFSGISEAVIEIYINENRNSKHFGELNKVILYTDDLTEQVKIQNTLSDFLNLSKRNIFIKEKEEENEATDEK